LTDQYIGYSVSGITTSVENHLTVFAAEESRANNTVVDLEEFTNNLR